VRYNLLPRRLRQSGLMDSLAPSQNDEGRYRQLVEAVTDYAIYMLDATGVVTSWNPGAQRFKGYTAAEIIGQHFSRFYTEEDARQGCRNARSKPRPARASSKTRAGACDATAAASGPMW